MILTGLIAIQYWIILVLMAGLFCSRKSIGRWVIGALVVAISRFFIRAVIFQLEGGPDGLDHTLSSAIGNEWLIVGINIGVLWVLFSEMITGTKCWRIYKIKKHKRHRGQIKTIE